jgi:hypothetical protein
VGISKFRRGKLKVVYFFEVFVSTGKNIKYHNVKKHNLKKYDVCRWWRNNA